MLPTMKITSLTHSQLWYESAQIGFPHLYGAGGSGESTNGRHVEVQVIS